MLDIDTLVRWLGPAGAKAGLLGSDLTLKALIPLAKAKGLPLSPKPTREEVAHELVYSLSKRIDRSVESLLKMNLDEIKEYFKQVKPSRTEILSLLSELGVSVSSEASRNLYSFAAREISDLGMYQRVARGSQRRVRSPE